MKEYEVTIDSLNEQYVYVVTAESKAKACVHSIRLAERDGLNKYAHGMWVKARKL